MSLSDLLTAVTDKSRFQSIENYIEYCLRFLEFIETGLQARIIAQREVNYQFYQYREDGGYNVTRPVNARLMYDLQDFQEASGEFLMAMEQLKEGETPPEAMRQGVVRCIYTLQQAIGATLDALPVGRSNQARKMNGDLFERMIRLLIHRMDVACVAGTMQVPVKDLDGKVLFNASYQHDLVISREGEIKAIGSVKTSSKDRLDKVFMDKFLFNRLTQTTLPHVAIFLNDVQRKRTRRENEHRISSTFLPGHFRAYTVRLNPLDGVYYCDIRKNMIEDAFLSQHIKTIDHFFWTDLRGLLGGKGTPVQDVILRDKEI